MTEVQGEVSIHIRAEPQAVYDHLLDFTKHSRWVSNLQRVWKVSEGPIGVGTVFRALELAPPVSFPRRLVSALFFIVGLVQGANTYSEAEITALDPGRRLAWRARVPGRKGDFNQAEWEVLLEPEDGATRVIQRFHYFPQTPTAERMLASLDGATGIEQACTANLLRLKSVLEGMN